jgi:lipoate-protein ligase A
MMDGPADGAWNMAVDRAVLAARAAGTAPPTLRLYWWRVPTASLGRFQSAGDVDLEACRELGFDVVRRPTGGRGVLHDHELTYSMVGALDDGIPPGVAASYRWLSGPLLIAYHALGVDAALATRSRGERSAACYLHATHADLSLGAAKLSGSAQVWDGTAVLQHGSFVIDRDVMVEARLFRLEDQERRLLVKKTATLARALGREPGREEIAEAVVEAVGRDFGVTLERGALSAAEHDHASRLVATFRVAAERHETSTST